MRRLQIISLVLFLARASAAGPADDEYLEHVNAGKTYFLVHGNMFRATWELREAMRMSPARVEAWRTMGACFVKHGETDRGIMYLHEALRCAPENGLSHYWLGMAQINATRWGLARFHLDQSRLLLKESDFPDRATFENSIKHAEELISRAEREGASKFDLKAFGPPKVLRFEYVANLYGNPPDQTAVSAQTGQPLVKELLVAQAYDADGRLLDPSKLAFEWGCSAGLTRKDGAILAGDKPGKEVLSVTETGSKLTASQEIVILGPAVKLEISPATTTLALAQRLNLEARALDAAGHPVFIPDMKWAAVAEGGGAAAGLERADTTLTPGNFFEPHRNIFAAPEETPGPPVTVTASTESGALSATAKITVEKRKSDKLGSRARAVTWENLSLDEAMKKAAEQKKMLLVEISASWCQFCKKFEEGPLSEPRVGEALRDWLAVQVDADAHPEIVERYGVVDLPMVALLSPRGTLVGSFGNNLEPSGTDPRTTGDSFLKSLEEAKKKAPGETWEEDRRLGDVKDPGKMASLARWYYQRVRWTDAEKWAREAMKTDAKLSDEMMPYATWSAISYGRADDAVKEIDAYIAANPRSEAAPQLLFQKGLAFARNKNMEKAKAVFAEIQKKWPTSSWARKAAQAAKK